MKIVENEVSNGTCESSRYGSPPQVLTPPPEADQPPAEVARLPFRRRVFRLLISASQEAARGLTGSITYPDVIRYQKGTAMIELAAAVSIIAIFLVVISQFATLFDQAVHDTANAEALASRSINEWDMQHAKNGFKRPCLEDMEKHSITYGGDPIAIGVGAWRRMISVPQEVKIVSGEICAPW